MIGESSPNQESPMRASLMLTLSATAMLLPCIAGAGPNGDPALTGIFSSEAEGKMEGVVVTARQAKSIVEVSVTTDADGRYSFPRTHVKPGQYTLSTRAVGYDIAAPAKATVSDIEPASADIKLKNTKRRGCTAAAAPPLGSPSRARRTPPRGGPT